MKKISILITRGFCLITFILFCLGLKVYAQAPWYGQIKYHPSDSIILSSAVRTFSNSGYIMAGFRPVRHVGSNLLDFVITKVDDGGLFSSATDFSIDYQIFDDQISCVSPVPVYNCSGVSVIETSDRGNGETYAMVVAYKQGVFFATLDAYGGVINRTSWLFPSTNYNSTRPRIMESVANPGFYYLCGGATQDMYVAMVDFNANVLWSYWYYVPNTQPLDLIESPYNSDELIVVGRTDIQFANPTASDAFFMKINSINGNYITANHYNFMSWDSDDWFSKIEVAKSQTGGDGYILGGRAFGPRTNPATPPVFYTNIDYIPWMCKLDRNGNVIWSSLIRPGLTTAGQLSGAEIVGVYERANPNGTYEYYGVGGQNNDPYTLGSGSLVTYKLDDNGVKGSLTPTEFHYNAGGSQLSLGPFAWGAMTAIETGGGSDDGLQVYGTNPSGLYFVKSYFNGVSGCNENIVDIDTVKVGPQLVGTFQPNVVLFPSCGAATLATVSNRSITKFCYTPSIVSGDNSRSSQITGITNSAVKNEKLTLFPNPATDKIVIQLNNPSDEHHSVYILNSLGQVVRTSNIPKGNFDDLIIDIQGLPSGIYTAELKGKSDFGNLKFVIQ